MQSELWTGKCVFPNSARVGGQVSGSKYVTRCLWSGWGTGAYGKRLKGSLLLRRPQTSSRRLCGRPGLCKEYWLSFWQSRWEKCSFCRILDQKFGGLSIYTVSATSLLHDLGQVTFFPSLGLILSVKMEAWHWMNSEIPGRCLVPRALTLNLWAEPYIGQLQQRGSNKNCFSK